MTPNIPDEAKPHEVAVLLAYSLGYRTPEEITKFLHHETKSTAYKTLRKYKDVLPEIIVAYRTPLARMS